VRSARTMKQSRALALAAAIGVAGSALAPVPAFAQETPDSGDSGNHATPPPVDKSKRPSADGQPDKRYKQTTGCVEQDLRYKDEIQNAPWGQRYLRIDEVHSLMRSTTGGIGLRSDNGEPVKVAVIDTGVRNHTYFKHDVEGVADYVKRDSKGLEDCDGHGTEVAGIIAADTPDHIGFIGVAPDAKILSIRQSSQNYSVDDGGAAVGGAPTTGPSQDSRTQDGGGAGTLSTLAKAIVHAADRGAQVINISINNCRPSGGQITPDEVRLQAAIDYAVNTKDAVIVSAAGNASDNTNCEQNSQALAENPTTIVTPPWFADDVLSVAAIDDTGSVADFSMHGPWVSVAAPGTGIISLDPAAGSDGLANMMIDGGEAQEIKGTSFAAPYVAGLAALVRAKYPHLDAHQVMHRIKFTAQHPAAEGGRDNFIGYGVIDPMAALTATVPAEENMPPAEAISLPSDMPPPANRNWTPMVVALAGSGGALAALGITLFVVHTIRRNRKDAEKPARP
jgi:membrane-anchored mycosin MYCP